MRKSVPFIICDRNFFAWCTHMSDQEKPQGADEVPELEFFDPTRQEHVPELNIVPELDEDAVLRLTRRMRLRQVRLDLEKNGGEMPVDPEERKIFMQNLKDLEGTAVKIKMVGAKEKSNATERMAVEAVLRIMQQTGGQDPYRQATLQGEVVGREAPSITQATGLPPLDLVPDETAVGVADLTYEQVFGEDQ